MANKNSGSKTILIVVAVVLGILLIGGIIFGAGCWWLYKVAEKTSEATTTPTSTSTENWKTYQNSRYGFSIKYPQTFASQESINGDGVTLTSSSPAITIVATGVFNSPNESLDDFMTATKRNLMQEQSNAKETSSRDATLGGIPAKESVWQFVNSNGNSMVVDLVSALKKGNFYILQMVIAESDYSEYQQMFGQVLSSFSLK